MSNLVFSFDYSAQRRSSLASASSRESTGPYQQLAAGSAPVVSGHGGGALPSGIGGHVIPHRIKPLSSLSIEDLPTGALGSLGHHKEGPLRSPGLLSTASMWSTSDLRQAGASANAGGHGVIGMAFSKQEISADAASQ
ncbi:hypothetical protein RRG08_000890 [Elysia crispata]|uniref:Uncharacterized protein n=1 Tax=Elysia crispata TaxID=231223 RepID=A0AAE1D0Z3_9GAST|nr:hypothetical protein RRG08_000890 [Elysia crispata]